jgi:hypothetical protein
MKHLSILLLFLVFICTKSVKAQSVTDSIRIYKGAFGNIYLKDGKSLRGRTLYKVLSKNPETLPHITAAKTNNIFGNIFGGAGGFILGYQLGSSYTRSRPNWFALSSGAVLAALQIPFEVARVKYTKKAVLVYNNDILKTSSVKSTFNFGLSSNGFGLKIGF